MYEVKILALTEEQEICSDLVDKSTLKLRRS